MITERLLSPPRRPQRRASCEIVEFVSAGDSDSDSDSNDDNLCIHSSTSTSLSSSSTDCFHSPTPAADNNPSSTKGMKLSPTISPTSVEELIFPQGSTGTVHSSSPSSPRRGTNSRGQKEQRELSPYCYRRHLVVNEKQGDDGPAFSITLPLMGDGLSQQEYQNEYCPGCDDDSGRLYIEKEDEKEEEEEQDNNDRGSQSSHSSLFSHGGKSLQKLLVDWTRTIEHEHDKLTSCSTEQRATTTTTTFNKKKPQTFDHTDPYSLNNGQGLELEGASSSCNNSKVVDDKDEGSLDDLELLEESFQELQTSDSNLLPILDSIDLALERLRVHQE